MGKVREFYNQNRYMIWIIILILVAIIVLIQILNSFISKRNDIEESNKQNTVIKSSNNNINENYSVITGQEVKKEVSQVIDDFVYCCNNNEPEKAYALLSDECKKALYPTLDDFTTKYYQKLFKGNITYLYQSWITYNNKYTYKIDFIEDMLSTGKASNTSITDYYTIVKQNEAYKLNINKFIGIENINKSTTRNNIKITIKKELRSVIRDKKSLLMMALTPLFIPIFVILMSYMYETLTSDNKETKYQVGVNYNLSTTEKELLSPDIEVTKYNSQKDMEEAYKKDNIIAYITKENNNYNIYANSKTEDGSIVLMYITNYLDSYNNYLGQNYLLENNIDISKVYNNINYTTNELKGESMFASEVVLMAITFTIMAITLSSIYASTDSTAGEKERGTLETILTFPIARKELILGKYFSICISGIITMSIGVILSITSLFFVKNNFTIYDNVIFNMTPITIVLTIIILIFYTLFISGLCIAIASFTKTFKEAQSALTPISLITCVPMFLSMLNINLNGILNFIPIVNHTIVINDILTGTINTNNILITIISSTIYIIILISLISKIYKSEKILFN